MTVSVLRPLANGPEAERMKAGGNTEMGQRKKVKEVESLTITGMDGLLEEQNEARIEREVNEIQETMRKPLADVSQQAGKMERESPLFFGRGDNPSLF